MTLLPRNTVLGELRVVEVFRAYDGRKLFVAENLSGGRYLVFWLGDEDEADSLIYVPVSGLRLDAIKIGMISLREAITRSEESFAWRVDLGNTYAPIVRQQRSSAVSEEDLPAADARLQIKTDTLPQIAETPQIRATRTLRHIPDFAISPIGALRNTAPVNALAESLLSAQKVIDALVMSAEGQKSNRGNTPTYIAKEAQLLVVAVFPSSFGIRLEGSPPSDLFSESRTGAALGDLLALVRVAGDEPRLKGMMEEHGSPVASRYLRFLKALRTNKIDLKLTWARPLNDVPPASVALSWKTAASVEKLLRVQIEEMSTTIEVSGVLEGANIHTKTFNLFDTLSGERYGGAVDDSVIASARAASAKVPAPYLATLVQTHSINAVTAAVTDNFRLVKLRAIIDGLQRVVRRDSRKCRNTTVPRIPPAAHSCMQFLARLALQAQLLQHHGFLHRSEEAGSRSLDRRERRRGRAIMRDIQAVRPCGTLVACVSGVSAMVPFCTKIVKELQRHCPGREVVAHGVRLQVTSLT